MDSTSSNLLEISPDSHRKGERFQALLETSSVAIVVVTPDWELIDFNDAWCRFLGYQRTELLGVSPRALTHPDDRKKSNDRLQSLINGSRDSYRLEKRYIRKDGEVLWGDLSTRGLKDGSGNTDAIVATIVDITQRKQQEAELEYSADRFRDFAEISSDWFWETDAEDRFSFFSRRFESVLGVRPDQLMGKVRGNVRPPGISDEAWEHWMNDWNNRREFRSVTHSRIRTNGEEIWISVNGKPCFDKSGTFIGYRGTATDITDEINTSKEIERSQELLVQSSKLASLGEMATGTAHEINQPLHIIRMAAEALNELLEEGEVPAADVLKTRLDRIISQTVRAADIIDRMRVFGRSPLENISRNSFKEAVLAAANMMSEQLRLEGIELDINVPENCRQVMGDLIQLEQVTLNLLTNARDSILENQNDVANVDCANRLTVRVEDNLETNNVTLVVQDTGGGIPAKFLPKIFEPFMTTKEVGKGTGLGLSISYGIVTDMGGNIVAENSDGGARFTVTLPAIDDAES